MKHPPFFLAICSFAAAPAVLAADLDISVQIPQLDVAEYHRPYVAVWLEREDHSVAGNLALWYSQKRGGGPGPGGAPPADAGKPAENKSMAGGEGGTKWLPDLRQWWRRSGREISVPIDGVSGATRPVGEQKFSFTVGKAPLAELAPGKYKLLVEAAREDGGRELVDIPFEWPVAAETPLKTQGKSELGGVSLLLKP
ncbi:MAG: hypothetical protein JWQ90_58 [Hydrocarboniphaga sp.]|uniref:DUF2271 domain-containing protein n=1 Tax=Hydrocarboniphaga sp. TaxID=2033016 RepID=UPI002623E058|nr:DUF2271 domain-containing protein [Hydrocarboniphaga sp.]MDB5967608.1 hypothetical protein [Hydrocarboniphaga sp.]